MSAVAAAVRKPRRSALPGFGLSMGITIGYLTLLVLIPLSTVVLKTSGMGLGRFWKVVSSPRALHAYELSIGTSLAAAAVNTVFGLLVAWVLVRYRFIGRTVVDALIDLPFALPTSVSGIALATLYSENGWFGRGLASLGNALLGHPIKAAFNTTGIVIALTFVTLPFVIRTVQPVLEELDGAMEEAAATLGASRLTTFRRVILPNLVPPMLTGFALAFARALGEYGSIVFMSSNVPMKTEMSPLLIMTKLEQFDYAGATAIALVMLVLSFVLLLAINRLQSWSRARIGHGRG